MFDILCDIVILVCLYLLYRTSANSDECIRILNEEMHKHREIIQGMEKELTELKFQKSYKNYGGTADVLMDIDYDSIEGEKVTYKVNERREK
jgi:hypothetical protein